MTVSSQRQVQWRGSLDVRKRSGFPIRRPRRSRLGLPPDGSELASGLKVLRRSLFLLGDALLSQRDHSLHPLGFERLAVGLVKGVVETGPVGLEVDLALGETHRLRALAGGNLIVAVTDARAGVAYRSRPPRPRLA